MRVANRTVALLGGALLTVGTATVGLLRLGEIVRRPETDRHPEDGSKRVKLGPTGLYYFEDENTLRLTVEMASDNHAAYYIVYVWTPAAWVREMPDWCRHRREEVLPEIERLTSDKRIKWVDED